MKGTGKVVAITPTSVTVALDPVGPAAGTTLTASFTADTTYVDGDTTLSTRPDVAVGDTVVIGAERHDGGPYQLIMFGRPGAQGTAAATGEQGTKVEGKIASVSDGLATMTVTAGQLPAGRTITIRLPDSGSATKADCGLVDVTPGTQVGGVLGPPDASGVYPVIALGAGDAQVSKG
jgi:hypothetical protein